MTFSLQRLLRKNIRDINPYSTARDEFQGIASVYLDANESPFDSDINRYPDPMQHELKVKVSRIKNVHPHQIFLGNGSDEAIDLIYRAFCEPGRDNVVAMKPTYGMYKVAADINDVTYKEVLLNDDYQLNATEVLDTVNKRTKAIFLCSPNNPTANSLVREDVLYILNKFNGIVVLDEAYIDFSTRESYVNVLNDYPNLVVLQTFSKAWGMAGVRLGMSFASKEITEVFNNIKYPYNVNVLTQKKVLEMLDKVDEKNENVQVILNERKSLVIGLKELECVDLVYSSDANFVLVKVPNPKGMYDYLLKSEIIVRDRSNVALCEGCLRITIGTPDENKILLKALKAYK